MQMNVLRTKQVSHVGNPDDHGQPIGQPIAQVALAQIASRGFVSIS